MTKPNITIRERDAEVNLKQAQAKEKIEMLSIERDCIIIDKLERLQYMLTASIVDEGSASGGFDQRYKPVFDESEQATIKDKIFELIHKL